MTWYILLLSLFFVMGCLGTSLKPSPIYGGLCLVASGCAGCLLVLAFGGSFLGLMVFLIYLGGMMVVFGYTAAMSAEEYPETWMSNWLAVSVMMVSMIFGVGTILMIYNREGLDLVLEHSSAGGWVVHDGEDLGLMEEGGAGVAALYDCSLWLMVISGWTLFVGIFIIIEVTRGS